MGVALALALAVIKIGDLRVSLDDEISTYCTVHLKRHAEPQAVRRHLTAGENAPSILLYTCLWD